MELLHALQGIRSPFLDTIIGYITMLGEETIAIVLLCLIYWCYNKRIAYIVGVAYFFSGLAVQGMKIGFQIDRPWVTDPTLKPVESAIKTATGYSFPSGHTQSATALFGTLALKMKKTLVRLLCVLIVLLVAFSRLYLGVHTLLDVCVSLIITTLIVLVVAKIFSGEKANKARDFLLALVLVISSVAVIVIAAMMYSGGSIEQAYLSDCLKAAGAGIGFAVGMYIERLHIGFSIRSKNILMHIIKFIVGLIGVLLILEGLKLIIGTGLVVDTVRYFVLLIWITVLYPVVIKRFFAKS